MICQVISRCNQLLSRRICTSKAGRRRALLPGTVARPLRRQPRFSRVSAAFQPRRISQATSASQKHLNANSKCKTPHHNAVAIAAPPQSRDLDIRCIFRRAHTHAHTYLEARTRTRRRPPFASCVRFTSRRPGVLGGNCPFLIYFFIYAN